MNDKIKILLDQQTNIILKSLHSINYLINFSKYTNQIGYQPKELIFLYDVIRDQTIIYSTQLFHGKEQYSFNELRKIWVKNFEIKDSSLKDFDQKIKPGNKLFSQLDILKIRNNHVGHLLRERETMCIDWNKVRNLMEVAMDAHDHVNSTFFDKQNYWLAEKNMILEVFNNNYKAHNLTEKWREMWNKSIDIMDRDEVGSLVKLSCF